MAAIALVIFCALAVAALLWAEKQRLTGLKWLAKPAAAPLIDIEQGVVYVFTGEKLTRYA